MIKDDAYTLPGELGSHVYVFMSPPTMIFSEPHLCCCMCALMANEPAYGWEFHATSTAGMWEHLLDHEEAGHKIPRGLYLDLADDDDRNFPRGGRRGEPQGVEAVGC